MGGGRKNAYGLLADFSKYTCNLTVDREELLDYIQVKETLHMTMTHSTLL